MNAPDRSRIVAAVCRDHPEAFGPPAETHDARRLELLRRFILPALNLMDQGSWGYLTKTDQNGRVPCDVVVWKETRQHFDVMTGTGPTWLELGVLKNPGWVWTANDPMPPPDPPVPVPVPTPTPLPANPIPSHELSLVLQRLDAMEGLLVLLDDRLDTLLLTSRAPIYRGRILGYTVTLTPDSP